MIEQNSGGSELTQQENESFQKWESEIPRFGLRKRAQYASYLMFSSVAITTSEVKDWLDVGTKRKAIIDGFIDSLATMAVSTDPEAYRSYRTYKNDQDSQ